LHAGCCVLHGACCILHAVRCIAAQELKVDDPEKYDFNPKQLLTQVRWRTQHSSRSIQRTAYDLGKAARASTRADGRACCRHAALHRLPPPLALTAFRVQRTLYIRPAARIRPPARAHHHALSTMRSRGGGRAGGQPEPSRQPVPMCRSATCTCISPCRQRLRLLYASPCLRVVVHPCFGTGRLGFPPPPPPPHARMHTHHTRQCR
jgi:hypothetical protein